MYTNGKTVRIFRGGLLAAAALGAAGVLTACGTGTTAAPQTAGALSPSASAPAAISPSGPAAQDTGATDDQASNASTAQGPRFCKAADLKVTLAEGNGAGMSKDNVNLRFTNKSGLSCALQGSPGVSFVAGDDGHQVGDPATRQPKSQGKAHTLTPGTSVQSSLTIVNSGVYTPSDCKQVEVKGLRIYAPGDTASMFLPMPDQACSATGYPQLSVDAVA